MVLWSIIYSIREKVALGTLVFDVVGKWRLDFQDGRLCSPVDLRAWRRSAARGEFDASKEDPMARRQNVMKRVVLATLGLITLQLVSSHNALASIDYVSGDVSGTWCADTVMVTSETRVPQGQRLQICAGVKVLFWTHCKLVVDTDATLIAVGTTTDSILFDEYWPGNGWGGIRFLAAADSSRLEYCHLTHGSATGSDEDVRGGAVYCAYSSPTIRHSRIDYCSSAGGGGGIFARVSDLTVEDCVVASCAAGLNGGGINVQEGKPQILRNVVQNNSASDSGGGILSYQCSPTITENVIEGNAATNQGGGMWCMFGRPTIRSNDIVENSATNQGEAWGGGVYISDADSLSVLANNTIRRNTANGGSGAYGGGLFCYAAKGLRILENTFEANQVSNGYYYTSANGAGVNCEASEVTIADNHIIGNEAHTYGVGWGGGIYFTNCPATSSIENNQIDHNKVLSSGGIASSSNWDGAGISCMNTNPLIRGNTFKGNAADGFGGAIDCINSSPIIEDCVIDSCTAGIDGGGISTNGHPTIRNNTITRCVANRNGGGMNLCCSQEAIPEIRGNVLHDNHAVTGVGGGIGMYVVTPIVFELNEISDNSAAISGGGMFINNSTPTLNKCTIVNNVAPAGGGVDCEKSTVEFVNCILFGNQTSQIGQQSNSYVQVRYSDVQGVWPGNGNIHEDPHFENAATGNYHLTELSPCVDLGNPEMGDLDPDDTRADMGCYHFPVALSAFTLLAPGHGARVYIDEATTFQWTAAAVSDPSDSLSGYELLWSSDPQGALSPVGVRSADVTEHVILANDLPYRPQYYWWVRARSVSGRERWARPTAGFMFETAIDPVGLAAEATAQEGGIVITWRVFESHHIDTFLILRRELGAEEWIRVSPPLSRSGGEYRYLDQDVEANTRYEYAIEMTDLDGSVNRFGPIAVELAEPTKLAFHLRSNPGRDVLNLAFSLPEAGDVTLRVFDVQGREAARTVERSLKAGIHHLNWRPGDANGRTLPRGVYLVRLEAPSGHRTARWVVVR